MFNSRRDARKRAGTRLGRLGRSTSSHVRDFLVEGNDGETRLDFLAYKRTVNEAQGVAAIQSKESIKVDGKNIFPYQYENGYCEILHPACKGTISCFGYHEL